MIDEEKLRTPLERQFRMVFISKNFDIVEERTFFAFDHKTALRKAKEYAINYLSAKDLWGVYEKKFWEMISKQLSAAKS